MRSTRLGRRCDTSSAETGSSHNTPHGTGHKHASDGDPRTDWRLAAERAGNAILQANPDWLIIVEGIERQGNDWYWWGSNLAEACQFPVRLSEPENLVYEAHDYGPEVSQQKWFQALTSRATCRAFGTTTGLT